MAFELRELSGSVFKNKKKEKDSHPDLTGEAKIGGVIYWVNAWRKTDKNGNEWISFAFKEKDFTAAKEAVKEKPTSRVDDFDDFDTIPF
jgi:uncharacterized protein (DUF736 family)